MNPVLFGLLRLFGVVAGYLVLLFIGKRFFIGRYRAEAAAAAVVIAFNIGITWPLSSPVNYAPQSITAAGAPAAAPSPRDVGQACASAHLTSAVAKGNVDVTNVQSGSTSAPATLHYQLATGDLLVIRGWAANLPPTTPAVAVCAVVDGKILTGVKALYGFNRTDVASALQNSALAATGYEVSVPADRFHPGRHIVQVAAVVQDGSAALLPGSVSIAGVGNSAF